MIFKFMAGAIPAVTALFAGLGTSQAAPTSTCYVNNGYVVSATPDETGDSDVFSVKRKTAADQTLPCPLGSDEADLVVGKGEYGYRYQDLVGDHLVLLVSPGAIGNVVVVDLRNGRVVLDVSGTYESSDGTELRYWQRGAEGTKDTCPIFDELKANGLGVGLLDEMVLNLETGVRTATGETDCEGLS